MDIYQVTIHIQDKALKFADANDLLIYVRKMQRQGDWEKFTHFPLLKVIYDPTGEEHTFATEEDLPVETLMTDDGVNKLIVIENTGGPEFQVSPIN